jgi:hypothetical protein
MLEGMRDAGMLHFGASRMSYGTPARMDLPAAQVEFNRAMPHRSTAAALHSDASVPVGRRYCQKRGFHTGTLTNQRLRIVAAEGRGSTGMTGATIGCTASQVLVGSKAEPDRRGRNRQSFGQ